MHLRSWNPQGRYSKLLGEAMPLVPIPHGVCFSSSCQKWENIHRKKINKAQTATKTLNFVLFPIGHTLLKVTIYTTFSFLAPNSKLSLIVHRKWLISSYLSLYICLLTSLLSLFLSPSPPASPSCLPCLSTQRDKLNTPILYSHIIYEKIHLLQVLIYVWITFKI